jgi:hypothetical protein
MCVYLYSCIILPSPPSAVMGTEGKGKEKEERDGRWSDTTGGTMHDTKNTTRTRHDTMRRSVSVGTTRLWAVSGPRSRHAVPARTRHEN